MNGDAQKIYNKIVQIETKQSERHEENLRSRKEDKKVISVIFTKLEKLDNLPCETHIERMAGFLNQLVIFRGLVIGTILGGIVLGFWVHSATGG